MFSVSFNPIDTNDILDVHKHLMKSTQCKIMFGLIKKVFTGLLSGLVKQSENITRLTFINLHLNEYSQEFHYYPITVKLEKCVGSCNTVHNLCDKACLPNKTEDLNFSVFNIFQK